MGVGAKRMQHGDDVVDIVVEVETALGDRHHAGVGPVGDVDLGLGQQRFHGAAQQRGVVSRHRCDDQDLRVRTMVGRQRALEMDQVAEGARPDDFLMNRDAAGVQRGLVQSELGLAIAAGGALEQLESGGDRAAERRVRHRIDRVSEGQAHCIGIGTHRRHGRMVEFIHLVEHDKLPLVATVRLPGFRHHACQFLSGT